jgi:hypothetical protein
MTQIALNFVASHLLSSTSDAAIIDANGTFDVVKLHRILLQRLQQSGDTESPAADSLLDRVRIMRAFDLEGVREAIGEIQASMDPQQDPNVVQPKLARLRMPQSRRRESAVLDSEDDEEDSSEEAGEPHRVLPTSDAVGTGKTFSSMEGGLVVVDNFSTVMNPLMKSNQVQGNAGFLSGI